MDYLKEAERVHLLNAKWWTDLQTGKPVAQKRRRRLILMISELTECMEAERKSLTDDHLPHRKGAEVEMADFVIRCLDMLGAPADLLDRPIGWMPQDSQRIALIANDPIDTARDVFEYVIDDHDPSDYLFELIKFVTSLNRTAYRTDFATLIACAEYYCTVFGYDLWAAYEDKLEYNVSRADHQLTNRKEEGGKKW
jgi:hypothetical protein